MTVGGRSNAVAKTSSDEERVKVEVESSSKFKDVIGATPGASGAPQPEVESAFRA